ncbi:hypothetical protein [Phycobacter sp. K97]|uniref:hypothetical protein n=1 Tax=Phycobacter sedimenti TaxID=3133977 RepID=UPI00311D79D8
MVMLLEVEGKRAEQVREFEKVKAALRELESFGPHSYASLTRQDGSYVQVAGGKEKCLIVKRDFGDKKHYRASFAMPETSLGQKQVIECGAGHITVLANEVFSIEDVVSVWRSFFQGEPFPGSIQWNDMTGVLR